MIQQVIEPNRKIIISRAIDNQVAEEVITRIAEINDFDYDLQSNPNFNYTPEPIEIFINSVGGSASDGFAIISAMDLSTTPIITYGIGVVASMALAIFVAGDYRITHRNTRFMYHSVGYGFEGYIKDHKDYLKEATIIQDMYDDIIMKRTNLDKAKMEKSKSEKVDFYFSGKQAIEYGVAEDMIKRPERKIILNAE